MAPYRVRKPSGATASKPRRQDRRRRQAQGQAKAKAEGRYKGRPEDFKRNVAIASMLAKGLSWSQVQAATGCSHATVLKIANRTTSTADAQCILTCFCFCVCRFD